MTSFHRHLAHRLLIGGLGIAAILGCIALWWDVVRLDKVILDLGIDEARQIAPRLPTDLGKLDDSTRAQIKSSLETVVLARHTLGSHFVIAEIYNLSHRSIADAAVSIGTQVEPELDRTGQHFPPPGHHWYSKRLIGGEVYLQMVSPLYAPDGRQNGWFEGVYHISRQVTVMVVLGGLRTTFMVVMAVLATAALFYPLLISLNAGLAARSRALLHANLGTLEVLGSAIAKRDSDTHAHNYRVTLYAVRLAEAVGLPPAEIRALIKGAFLHDVGKIAIPDAILLKPGKLDPDEFAIMRTHVRHGLDIVGRFDWLDDAAAVVGGHHERVDGSGYPAGLRGEDIPRIARIFAIADVFDALTSRRPYKEPFPLEQATAILSNGAGQHFDAPLLATFLSMAPRLYEHLCGRDEIALQAELQTLNQAYFANFEG